MSRSRLTTLVLLLTLIFATLPASATPQNATFSLKNTSTKVYAASAVTADLNGDGVPDLIETYSRINPSLFAVQLGLGNGYFAAPVDYPSSVINWQYGVQIVTADVNKDGKADVIVVTNTDLLVYLGRGDGTLLPPRHYTLPAYAAYVAVADFNHDGNPDLVFAGANVSVAYGDGHGAFTAPATVMTPTSNQTIEALAVGDFDSDANADIAVALANSPCAGGAGCTTADVHILYGNGGGSFADKLVYTAASDISFSSGDLNNDGRTDLVVALGRPTGSGQNLVVLFGQSSRIVTQTLLH